MNQCGTNAERPHNQRLFRVVFYLQRNYGFDYYTTDPAVRAANRIRDRIEASDSRPQGGRLSGEHQEEVEQVINTLEAQGPRSPAWCTATAALQ